MMEEKNTVSRHIARTRFETGGGGGLLCDCTVNGQSEKHIGRLELAANVECMQD